MDNELLRKNQDAKQKLADDIIVMLGGELIDNELDRKSLQVAIDMTFKLYRQRAENAVEESYLFMELKENVNDYILPNEVVEVRQIFRRGFGTVSNMNNSSMIDPFEISYVNNYMAIGASGSTGSLANYELYMANIELAGKMFGYHYMFNWQSATKRLKIDRKIRSDKEEILLWIYNYIPDYLLLDDPYSGIWITKYALAEAKMILAQAYDKFSQYAGAQGGVTLNGATLRSEAAQEKLDLEQKLKTYQDGSQPLSFILG